MNCPSSKPPQDTCRLIDITGPENTLILLASPGDEVTLCGGFIAEACTRGRPPFIVILGDGAPDGCARLARERERASRTACQILGLPDDRLLFAGLKQNSFPAKGAPLFSALQLAMSEVSWRRDCNVVLAPFATNDSSHAADAITTWQLADALAKDIEVSLLARFPMTALPGLRAVHAWRLDLPQWDNRKAMAGLSHGYQVHNPGHELYGRLG